MPKKQLFKFSRLKTVLCVFILLSIFEAFVIVKLSREKLSIGKSFGMLCKDYNKSTKTHAYNVKIFNYDRDLNDVVLKYKTFTYKTIPIGYLAALDINLKDPIQKKKNHEKYTATVHMNDMASPIFFEITGTCKDGTVFEDNISGFDIRSENETFEVYIYKDHNGLSYH